MLRAVELDAGIIKCSCCGVLSALSGAGATTGTLRSSLGKEMLARLIVCLFFINSVCATEKCDKDPH